jgi:hypothetical protein
MVLYYCVLIVFSLHRESLKLILATDPIPRWFCHNTLYILWVNLFLFPLRSTIIIFFMFCVIFVELSLVIYSFHTLALYNFRHILMLPGLVIPLTVLLFLTIVFFSDYTWRLRNRHTFFNILADGSFGHMASTSHPIELLVFKFSNNSSLCSSFKVFESDKEEKKIG